MALQSSGRIEMSEIAAEMGESLSNVSLGSMSDDAGFSAPDKMSDFYGHSNVTSSTWIGSARGNSSAVACSLNIGTTYYHNNGSGGSDSDPAINDYVYSDSGLTNKLAGGYYKVNVQGYDWVRVNGFGRIFATGICL
tara:strand:+ start:894 stop:1304 length:411 start_codon:yes stop_codon:yes gene_type:complete